MKININEAGVFLNLENKIVSLLRVVSKDGETVSLGKFVQVLNIMEFKDWDTFDKEVDKLCIIDNTNSTKEIEISLGEPVSNTPSYEYKDAYGFPYTKYKGVDGLAASNIIDSSTKSSDKSEDRLKKHLDKLKREINNDKERKIKDKKSKSKAGKKGKLPRAVRSADIDRRAEEYIKTHDSFTITELAKALNVSDTAARKRVLKYNPDHSKVISNSKSTSYHTKIQEYVDSHDVYYISEMAKELGIGETAIRNHLKTIDPTNNKHGDRRFNSDSKEYKNKESIFDYMVLNDSDNSRKEWIDTALTAIGRKVHRSKANILKPVIDELTKSYGIVFIQKGKDILYDHKFNPIEDYPLPTPYEVMILDEDIFSMASAQLIDKYELNPSEVHS